MERTSASGRAFIDFHYPYLSSFYASSLSSPAQQSPTLQSCDSGRSDMCPNHSPSDPHCLALSHLFLSSRAFGQRLPAQRRYMLTPSLYSTPITDTPEIAITIQNLDTAERRPRMYIGLSSYSLTRGVSSRSSYSIRSSPFTAVFPSLGDRFGGTTIRRLDRCLTFSLFSSLCPLFVSFGPTPPFLLGRHFHPRST